MVAQEEITPQSDNTGAFGKLKQTLSSSLLTAQDKGNNNSKKFFLVLFYIGSTNVIRNRLKC